MKTRFNSYDIVCAVKELQSLVGLRLNQIYDIDNKSYLFRFQSGEAKEVLLIESGIRFHTTSFEWPKNLTPSGFSMKLRKHLKNKRLEKLQQLGVDRIIDLQFGAGEALYHVIVELYDRGNIILTDHEHTILYVLRPHHEGEEVRFAVREKYPINRAKGESQEVTEEIIKNLILSSETENNLRRLLMPIMDCGPTVIDHVLTKYDLDSCTIEGKVNNSEANKENGQNNEDGEQKHEDGVQIGKKTRKKSRRKQNLLKSTRPFQMEEDMPKVMQAIQEAYKILIEGRQNPSKGYIIQQIEEKPVTAENESKNFYRNIEYHPYHFAQFKDNPVAEFDTFMMAVDEFYSTLEGQKIDLKALQQERDALKKLSNVQKDHEKRLENLVKVQETDIHKAELISRNQALVDNAILAISSAIASQMSWPDIYELVKAAQANGDIVACTIKQLKLEVNHIALQLSDPYHNADSDRESQDEDSSFIPTQIVDVDLSLSAWANARKYYDQKKTAAQKEQKTIDASQKALKSAERKTQQTLKDVKTISTISKARKVYWFEKFYWFISSENYLVIGGRDAQQNELIVKRYMRPTDIYVHAEIQGASSVIVRNPGGGEIPPKTLLEAGTMAISYSVAWDAKVVTNAYWVYSEQVSKTAPSGEYLGTGSFMIRGKKNFLPPCHLIMGLSLLFKVEDSFVEKHRGERRVRTFGEEEDHQIERLQQLTIENEKLESVDECVEIELDENLQDNGEKKEEINGTQEVANVDKNIQNNSTDEEANEKTDFPDTEVKVHHDTGRITIRSDSTVQPVDQSTMAEKENVTVTDLDDETLISAAPSRKKQQTNAKKRKEEKEKEKKAKGIKSQQNQNTTFSENQKQNAAQMKRGQKGKLKKIKAKYKDQDEEERALRMQFLKPAGNDKILAQDTEANEEKTTKSDKNPNREFSKPTQQARPDIEDVDDLPPGADVEMIDALTGVPCEDDEILFAIPVVAPYQALQNYKFKVKLTPGTGKRGKAAKMALMIFSKDKSCGAREKDLLKGIKDETLARNIPGKVKLSAPQLQKLRKKE